MSAKYEERWCVYRKGGSHGAPAVGIRKLRTVYSLGWRGARLDFAPNVSDRLVSHHDTEAEARMAFAAELEKAKVAARLAVAGCEEALAGATERLEKARAFAAALEKLT